MRCWLGLFIVTFSLLSAAPADELSSGQAAVRIEGSEQLTLSAPGAAPGAAPEESTTSQYCLWLQQAQEQKLSWSVEHLPSADGQVLRSLAHTGLTIPFDIKVQAQPSETPRLVRSGSVIARGESVGSHCGAEGSLFLLQITPLFNPDLIPGGLYQQTLSLRLTTGEGETAQVSRFDIRLRLQVSERVGVTVFNHIELPTFTGENAPEGQAMLCLFRNGSGAYSVRLRGDSGPLRLSRKDGGVSRELDYVAFWQGNGLPEEALQAGASSQIYTGSSFEDCRGGFNARLRVAVPVDVASRALSGRYQGRLRIVIQAR